MIPSSLGRIVAYIDSNTIGMEKGLRNASRMLDGFGNRLRSSGIGSIMIGGAIALPMVGATKVFAAFDDQMRLTKAVTGSTGKEFDNLTQKAKYLGRTTSYTASQVAGSMVELGRAGFKSKEIENAIGPLLNMARATGTDLSQAALIASGTLRAFEMETSQASRVADIMTAAANGSAQTLTDLGESMKYVAPVAKEFGMDLVDTSKALATLANFSIKGSMAGTSLRMSMLRLSKTSVQKKLKGIGVEVTNATGDMRNLVDILQDVHKNLQGMGQGEQLGFMSDIFGARAVSAGLKLSKANFAEMNAAIENSAGVAEKTAKEMDAGIGGSLRMLWSAAEGATIAIGEGLAPTISSLAKKIIKALGPITEFIEKNVKLIVIIAAVGAGFMTLGVVLLTTSLILKGLAVVVGAVALAFKLLLSVVVAIKVVVMALLSPLGLVLAILTAIVYATTADIKAIGWLGDKFQSLKKRFEASFGAIAKALASGDIGLAAKIMWLQLKLEWVRGVGYLESIWADFALGFTSLFSLLKRDVLDIWAGVSYGLKNLWDRFRRAHQKEVEQWANWFAKRMMDIKGLMDEDFDVEFAKLQIDKQSLMQLKKITSEYNKNIKANQIVFDKELANNEARWLNEAQKMVGKNNRIKKEIENAIKKAQADWMEAVKKASAIVIDVDDGVKFDIDQALKKVNELISKPRKSFADTHKREYQLSAAAEKGTAEAYSIITKREDKKFAADTADNTKKIAINTEKANDLLNIIQKPKIINLGLV